MPSIARGAANTLGDCNFRILVHDMTGPSGQPWTDLLGKPLKLIWNISQDQQVVWRGTVHAQGWIVIPLSAFASKSGLVLRVGPPGKTAASRQAQLTAPEQDFDWCEQYDIESLDQAFSSDDLKCIQVSLNQLGYCAGRIDGVLGPVATSALMRFQGDCELPVTGEPDADTLNKLLQETSKLESGA